MGRLRERNFAVADPSRLAPAVADQALFSMLTPLSASSLEAPRKAEELASLAKAARGAAAAQGVAATRKEQLENIAAAYDRAADAWKASGAAYEALMKDLATPDSAGVLWAAKVVEEKVLSDGLVAGDQVLFLKVHNPVGGYYTKKNLWTFFGSMPFWTMGGVVVSYELIDGKDGHVVASGMQPAHSGYRKVNDVADRVSTAPRLNP
jgi:hypothetical protein